MTDARRQPVRPAEGKTGMNELQMRATAGGKSELEGQMHEALRVLLDNETELPKYIRDLLLASTAEGLPGEVAWGLAGLWALGKVEYVAPNLWNLTPAQWLKAEAN